MLKMITGAKIDFADKLSEGYSIENEYIYANINCDKIEQIIKEFIKLDEGPYFLILEVPVKRDDEKDIVEDFHDTVIVSNFHKNVYYLDGMSPDVALDIFDMFKDLFINDGISRFGFGNHLNGSEIMRGKYNVVSIFLGENDSRDYVSLLENNGIKLDSNFKTAWDYFNDETFGESSKIMVDGKDIFDVVDVLKDKGLYLAEVREED